MLIVETFGWLLQHTTKTLNIVKHKLLAEIIPRSSYSYRRDSARCKWCWFYTFKVTQGHLLLCQSTQHDFLLALNGNLTSSTILQISRPVCTSILHLSSRWNWKKTAESRRTWFGARVPSADKLYCPTINLNLRQRASYDHNARPSARPRQTDEHHGNSATIRFKMENCKYEN